MLTTHTPPVWYFHPTYQQVAATLVKARKSLEALEESSSFNGTEIQEVKAAVDSVSETLLYQADKDINECTEVAKGTLATVSGALKKAKGQYGEYKELGPILFTLFNPCQNLLDEFQRGNPSQKIREKVKGQLQLVQKSLGQFVGKIKRSIDEMIPRLKRFKAAEEESTTYTKILPAELVLVQTTADLLQQMLHDEKNIRNPEVKESLRETQAKLERNKITLKAKDHPKLESIVYGLSNVCAMALNPTEGSHNEMMEQLRGYQRALKEMLNKTDRPSKPNPSQEYPVLDKILLKRFAKKMELHCLWERYDRKTEEITSHFDAQKKTAQVLSQLTLELRQFENTLLLLEKVSVTLSEVIFH